MSKPKILDLIPTGAIVQFSSNKIPDGWLLCDGSLLEQSEYPELFEVIGTTYGYYSRTDFRLPDIRGRVPVGKSTDTDFNELGKTGGEKEVTLTVEQMPAHRHDLEGISDLRTGSGQINEDSLSLGTHLGGQVYKCPVTVTLTGGGKSHNNMQPYIVLNYIIKYN